MKKKRGMMDNVANNRNEFLEMLHLTSKLCKNERSNGDGG